MILIICCSRQCSLNHASRSFFIESGCTLQGFGSIDARSEFSFNGASKSWSHLVNSVQKAELKTEDLHQQGEPRRAALSGGDT